MRVAILCPGPSLPSHYPSWAACDLIIGVNRVPTAFLCDVWAAGDLPVIEKWRDQIIGIPKLYTTAGAASHLRDHGPAWPGAVTEFESLHDGSEQGYQWDWLTMLSAIRYAWKRHAATEILVYGADWKGTQDFDGVEAGLTRGENRWAHEAQLFGNIAAHLKTHGVKLERIL